MVTPSTVPFRFLTFKCKNHRVHRLELIINIAETYKLGCLKICKRWLKYMFASSVAFIPLGQKKFLIILILGLAIVLCAVCDVKVMSNTKETRKKVRYRQWC